ncbi:protein-glutamate O-methyltransferase CheR [Clostridium sp. PL3]|uniref:Protein-glutamate O-methyltransferase CheR n=1 Tax=Clostridium thailandense TaxID=2794346 RepID=A0A949TUA7_9CLOT|nr:protein-glutamate O-methyltransferase CheR [Clostridium thailandense]MBV7276617.1 protein-glutamate O-methyltransferase CheR [Clostridium thailandense]
MVELKDKYFKEYSDLIYDKTGIFVRENKRQTFMMKIEKSMRRMKMPSHEEYLMYLKGNNSKEYFQQLVNDITTNTTEFFREKEHFHFIKKNLSFIMENNRRIESAKEIRIWCAGCSTGQESVSLAILLKEYLIRDIQIKILATDIDSEAIKQAIKGEYSNSDCEGIPKVLLNRYFDKVGTGFSVKEEIRNLIRYRLFNLMEEYRFKKNFDIIFCRNVMIYFNNNVQEKLVNKFYRYLVQGGLLFIGHSESLLNKEHKYTYIEPALYMK